jgi:hypothetical protein
MAIVIIVIMVVVVVIIVGTYMHSRSYIPFKSGCTRNWSVNLV